MNEKVENFLPGAISPAGKEREERIAQISPHVNVENMHDGSPRSLEFARLAVEVLDEYVAAMDFLLENPLLPHISREDQERLESRRDDFRGRRSKAQRAVEINLEKSLESDLDE